MDYLTTHTSLSPIRRGFVPGFVNYKKGCTRLAATSDKVYQLLAHGRWFSPASSTTKTGRHDIAESGVKHKKINQDIMIYTQAQYCYSVSNYSRTCIKRSPLGRRKSGCLRLVTSKKRLNSYEIFYDRTRKM